jgi:hypothetical protein
MWAAIGVYVAVLFEVLAMIAPKSPLPCHCPIHTLVVLLTCHPE